MQYNWFDISNEDRKKWEKICPPGEYRVISGGDISSTLSGVLPEVLFRKYNSVLFAGSATTDGLVYFMANGNRIDTGGSAIDQMPFGLAFIDNFPAGSGCLIQHGDWINRTTSPPSDFWDHITESGTPSYFPLSELPKEPAGKLTDLKIDSQNAAYGKLVEILVKHIGK
jgi:hypothetical protein